MEDKAPIVRVVHERDGDWQFIGPVAIRTRMAVSLAVFTVSYSGIPAFGAWRDFRPVGKQPEILLVMNGRSINTRNRARQNR